MNIRRVREVGLKRTELPVSILLTRSRLPGVGSPGLLIRNGSSETVQQKGSEETLPWERFIGNGVLQER